MPPTDGAAVTVSAGCAGAGAAGAAAAGAGGGAGAPAAGGAGRGGDAAWVAGAAETGLPLSTLRAGGDPRSNSAMAAAARARGRRERSGAIDILHGIRGGRLEVGRAVDGEPGEHHRKTGKRLHRTVDDEIVEHEGGHGEEDHRGDRIAGGAVGEREG